MLLKGIYTLGAAWTVTIHGILHNIIKNVQKKFPWSYDSIFILKSGASKFSNKSYMIMENASHCRNSGRLSSYDLL